MGKHKKPVSEHQMQRLNQQHHKNEFIKRLKAIVQAYSDPNALSLLTKQHIDGIYNSRVHTLKLVVAEGCCIDPCDRKYLESFILSDIKKETITAYDGTSVAMNDYMTVGVSMLIYLKRLEKTDSPLFAPILQAFSTYRQRLLDGENITERIYNISFGICGFLNNLGSYLYWVDPSVKFEVKSDGSTCSFVRLYKAAPEKETFVVDGQPRPAFRVGCPVPGIGIEYYTLRPSQIGITDDESNTPINVYIQSHALQRLSERLDCVDVYMVHYYVLVSLNAPRVIRRTQHKFFIELRVDKYKVGYLKAEMVNGNILIKTFLFITNSGTPEGKKLEELTGLKILDKKYLAIDKLSAFMASDIRTNETVMQVLRNMECEYLLELQEYLKQYMDERREFQHTGALLSMYLNKKYEMEQEIKQRVSYGFDLQELSQHASTMGQ